MNKVKHIESLGWCNAYINYLDFRSKGLRKQAMNALNQFFLDFQKQSKKSKREFINEANELAYNSGDYSLYLPVNLYEALFKPEIKEWINDEPYNPLPLIWTRDIEALKQAVGIDPCNQIALNMLGRLIVNHISMNQHELAAGFRYSGNPYEDVNLINFFFDYLDNLNDPETRNEFSYTLNQLKSCAVSAF